MKPSEKQDDDAPPIESAIARLAAYPRLSAADREFLAQLDAEPRIGTLPIAEERERMKAGQSLSESEDTVEISEFAASACNVYLLRPKSVVDPSPLFFLIHGGGWVLGDITTHGTFLRELAIRTKSVVAFVEYPRAPEHRFPVQPESCFTAIYEVLAVASTLGIDAERFAIGGDSSGGNLAATFVLLAIERKQTPPRQLVLLYPALDSEAASISYNEFGKNPNLGQSTMRWFWQQYQSDDVEPRDPYFSPIHASREVLARFPPTLVITCEYDVLRDEGEDFAARLIQAGVDVTAVRWLGALHSFVVTERLATSSSAQMCIDFVAQYIRRGLGTNV